MWGIIIFGINKNYKTSFIALIISLDALYISSSVVNLPTDIRNTPVVYSLGTFIACNTYDTLDL